MNIKATEILYNAVLASGRAKEIAGILSLNYATFMREINIYDAQAKLSINTFLSVADILEEYSLFYSLAKAFGIEINIRNKIPYISSEENTILLSELLQKLFIDIKKYPNKDIFPKILKKSFVRLLKELNIHDPSAKLGIDTLMLLLEILNDTNLVMLFLRIAGFQPVYKG